MNTKAEKQNISMTPRSSVEQNTKIKMPPPGAEQTMDKQARDAESAKPGGSTDDDGFNEFLDMMKSSGSVSAKALSESATTVVSYWFGTSYAQKLHHAPFIC